MLRIFVLLLLLANAAYLAWSQGWLREVGFAPALQTETQRLAQQIKPEAVRAVSAQELRRIEAQAAPKPPPPECLEAGLFDAKQSAALRRTLTHALPTATWTLEASVQPARWLAYMGKYPTLDAANKKKQELKARGVSFEALRNPSLEPGISLGGFDTQAKANQALKELSQKGVRTAKVVLERAEQRGDLLRLPVVDDKLRPAVDGIKEALGGRSLRSCSK